MTHGTGPRPMRAAAAGLRILGSFIIAGAVIAAGPGRTTADGEIQTGAEGITDPTRVIPPPPLALQPVGRRFVDPAFGTTLRRVSNLSDTGGYETQEYSQLQAFSADDAYLLTDGSEGFRVRRVSDLSLVQGLNLADINVPRWHPTRPHVLVHFDTNSNSRVVLQFTDVDTGTTTDVATLPGLSVIFVNQSWDEVSRDGKWIAGMARRSSDGQPVVFAYDMIDRSYGAFLPLSDLYDGNPCSPDPVWGQVSPDWIAPSPLGNYLVIQWPGDGVQGCRGLETYDIRTGAFVGRPYDGHQHGDLGVSKDGREFFMAFELYHPSGQASIGYRWLPGPAAGVGDPQYLLVTGWQDEHISCQGPPGSCLISTTENDYLSDWQPLEAELFLLSLDGSVLRLAHHRSSECGYWVQSRATISADGRYVAFTSDWERQLGCGNGGDGRGDPYIIELGGTPPGNRAPVADAGPDVEATVASVVTLDGRSSSDPDGDPISYEWAQIEGAAVSLSGGQTPRPSFAAPDSPGALVFRLTVSDGSLSSTDDVRVEVTEPTATGPAIARVTSRTWKPGGTLWIYGSEFSTSPSEDVVYMGGYSAVVARASTGALKTTIPARLRRKTTVDLYVTVNGRKSNTVRVRLR